MTDGRNTWTGLLALMAWVAALALLAVDAVWGTWDRDAGFFFSQGAMIHAGQRPYVDFAPFYPPLYQLSLALAISTGIDRVTLFWLVPVVWVGLIGVASQAYFRAEDPGPAWLAAGLGTLTTLFFIEYGGNHATLEHGVVWFGMLALLAWRGEPGARRGVVTGACLGAAFACKQVGLVLAVPFVLQVVTFTEGFALLAGFALPLLALAGWAGTSPFVFLDSLTGVMRYLARSKAQPDLSTIWSLRGNVLLVPAAFHAELLRAWLGLGILVGLSGIGLATAWDLWRHRAVRRAVWLLSWLGCGAVLAAAYLINQFPHYILNLWPAAVVILAAGLAQLGRRKVVASLLGSTLAMMLLAAWHGNASAAYGQRWTGRSALHGYVEPIAKDIRALTPPQARIMDFNERAILVVADRLPVMGDLYAPWLRPDPPEVWNLVQGYEPAYMLVKTPGYHEERVWLEKEAEARSLKPVKVWPTAWGTFTLYGVPVR